jgi:hypothetical protein
MSASPSCWEMDPSAQAEDSSVSAEFWLPYPPGRVLQPHVSVPPGLRARGRRGGVFTWLCVILGFVFQGFRGASRHGVHSTCRMQVKILATQGPPAHSGALHSLYPYAAPPHAHTLTTHGIKSSLQYASSWHGIEGGRPSRLGTSIKAHTRTHARTHTLDNTRTHARQRAHTCSLANVCTHARQRMHTRSPTRAHTLANACTRARQHAHARSPTRGHPTCRLAQCSLTSCTGGNLLNLDTNPTWGWTFGGPYVPCTLNDSDPLYR